MRRLIVTVACALAVLGAATSSFAEAQRRVALVIGNAAYSAAQSLRNPANDAALIGQALKRAGFGVVEARTNLGLAEFKAALRRFQTHASGAEVALVYYAGHGIEARGRNWLIPTDATLKSDDDLDWEAIDLDLVMHATEGARLRVVILDACRNNPFGRSWTASSREVVQGLGKVEADDVLVIYAAAPGQTAGDGAGDNGPFALAMARRLQQAGVMLQNLGNIVRDDVLAETGGRQRPFVSASITGTPYYLVPEGAAAAPQERDPARPMAAAAAVDPRALDLALWNSVGSSNDPAQLQAYLAQFPGGTFAGAARAKLAALSHPSPSPIAPVAASRAAPVGNIAGAGAVFPNSAYGRWGESYRAATGGVLTYQAIGSGGGVMQVRAGAVDFGATDKPLRPEVLQQNGLMQFPALVDGVVPVVDLPGVAPGELRLTGALLSQIYLGRIVRWNDPRLAAANPGLSLPNLPITPIHRSDSSATTFLFTTYLATSDPSWASAPGANDSVAWPVGMGGKGDEGVAAFVRQTVGAIGYLEQIYAARSHMTYAALQNRAGLWVLPTPASLAAAAAAARWDAATGFGPLLIDQPGPASWPITSATFILMRDRQSDPGPGRAVLAFFDWAYRNGDLEARQLDYVPLPEPVKALVRNSAWTQIRDAGGQSLYP